MEKSFLRYTKFTFSYYGVALTLFLDRGAHVEEAASAYYGSGVIAGVLFVPVFYLHMLWLLRSLLCKLYKGIYFSNRL